METYRQVRKRADVPPNSALIRFWRQDGRAVAKVDLDDDTAHQLLDPDLALLEASLALNRLDLAGLFVILDDAVPWEDRWGRLVAPFEFGAQQAPTAARC